jgi:hypothetical protein
VSLPILAPGTQWSGEIALTVPSEDYILTLSVVRPTGFSVTDHSYDAQGELVPSDGGVQNARPIKLYYEQPHKGTRRPEL